MQIRYWPHIDGLRAFAVMVVLFFHFKTPGFADGYLGVDIFFVISGFLVSRLILKDINEFGKVRYGRFFTRRVRRLFPALAMVCIVTAIAAYALFDSEKLAAFGKSVGAAIISLSNINFWSESGYFDVASETKPLLHTWSLSVEEQFYLIWPTTLALGYKIFKQRALKILSISGFLLSISLILIWTFGKFDARAESTIFFWMPFRVFEFMMGAFALLAFDKIAKSNRSSVQDILCVSGLLLMIGAIILPAYIGLSNGSILGLIVCTGAALVILSPDAKISNYWLSSKSVRWIGQISYSLYLVHWPLKVFLPEGLQHEPYMWVVLTAASILLAIPLHYLIENPLRHGNLNKLFRGKKTVDLWVFACTAIAVIGVGYFIRSVDELPFKEKILLTAEEINQGKKNRFKYLKSTCTISNLDNHKKCDLNKSKQVLFFGNSHEPDGFTSFYEIYKNDNDVNLIKFGTTNRCEINFKNNQISSSVRAKSCDERTKKMNELIHQKKITHFVYVAKGPYSPNKKLFWEIMEMLQENYPKINIIVMGGFLSTNKPCSEISNAENSFAACFKPKYALHFPVNERKVSKFGLAKDYLYIDKIQIMCEDRNLKNCETEGFGEPVFYDTEHLSLGYARIIGLRIKSEYAEKLANIGLPIQ